MALFNFLKPKSDPIKDALLKIQKSPVLRRHMIELSYQETKKRIENLIAVARESDGRGEAIRYLNILAGEKPEDIDDINIINYLTHLSIKYEQLSIGKNILTSIIAVQEHLSKMDLTVPYHNLGLIYHRIRTEPEKELWAYHSAAEAATPLECSYPSSTKEKAKAHHFGYMCALRLNNEEHIKWHAYKRAELVPELDWENSTDVLNWMMLAGA